MVQVQHNFSGGAEEHWGGGEGGGGAVQQVHRVVQGEPAEGGLPPVPRPQDTGGRLLGQGVNT